MTNKKDETRGGGIVTQSRLKKDGVELYYDDSQTHNIIIGTTGSGKTQGVILPSILSIADSDSSMIINDPKGELYALTKNYLLKKGFHVHQMDYLSPLGGSCFNQLSLSVDAFEEGLPHFYAQVASDEIIKLLDIISSGGRINDLRFFTKFQAQSIPDHIAKGDPRRIISINKRSGGVSEYYDIANIGQFGDNLLQLQKITDTKEIINFIRDIFSNCYETVQTDFQAKSGSGDFTDYLESNEYLKYRQEQIIMAATNILRYLNANNVKKYYEAKVKMQDILLEAIDKLSPEYSLAENNKEKFEEIIKAIDEAGLDIDIIRQYLLDTKIDHGIIWNEKESKASQAAESVAKMIVGDPGGGDKFWTNTAKDLISSTIQFVCRESSKPYSKHMGSVAQILAILTADNNGKSEYDILFKSLMGEDRARLSQASTSIAGDKTKASIYASALEPLSVFFKSEVVDQSSRMQFDPKMLVEEKTAVFLCTPGDDDSGLAQFTILATLFIEQTYSTLNGILNKRADQSLPRPVYFIIDEMANIPRIPHLDSKVSLARSKNMRFSIVIQSFDQLAQKYKVEANTIRENSNILYLLSNDTGTAEAISKRMGKTTIDIESQSSSSGKNGTTSTSKNKTGRELMTAAELITLGESKGIYMSARKNPYETELTPCWKWPIYKWLQANKLQNIHYRRNPQEVNIFMPEATPFLAAYDLMNNSCLLDKYFYNIFSSIAV